MQNNLGVRMFSKKIVHLFQIHHGEMCEIKVSISNLLLMTEKDFHHEISPAFFTNEADWDIQAAGFLIQHFEVETPR